VSEASEKLFKGACDFVAGAATTEAIPPPRRPEIAFVGRSNVGKSSLINALTHRKSLARISQTPGATKQINFFDLAGKLNLVDLPGYGFAQASKTLAQQWQTLLFAYLRGRPTLRRVILLLDARRGIMPVDAEAMKLLDEAAVSYLVVLTKADTLSAEERDRAINECKAGLARNVAAYPDILVTSAQTKSGLEALREHITALAAP
jgi:GTP-binding protein